MFDIALFLRHTPNFIFSQFFYNKNKYLYRIGGIKSMISKTKNGDLSSSPISNFLCDTRSDITFLPTHKNGTKKFPDKVYAGSTALVIEDASVWILNNEDVWIEL